MLDGVTKAFQKVFKTSKESPKQSKEEIGYADPLRLFGSAQFQSYNPSVLVTRQGMGIFDKMRMDDQVKASMEFKKHAVLSSGWEVNSPDGKPDDWEVTEFARWTLENLEGTLEETLIGILTFLEYGFSVSEQVFDTIDHGPFIGKLGLYAIKDKKPHYFNFKVDKFGNLEELLQTQISNMESLPPEKFVIYVHGKEFGNWYGRSDLEAAYRPWWAKTNAYQWLVMYLERMGIPPIFALYDPNVYSLAQKNDLKTVMATLQAATSGIMPRPAKPDGKSTDALDFWTPELSKQAKQVFIPSIDMFNRDISRAILMPGLLGFTPDDGVGSLARAKKHFDVFLMVVEYLRLRIEKRVMAEQVLNPLIDLNYSNIDDYPKFKFLPITDEVRADLLDRWIVAVEKGIVSPQAQDEKHIRTMLKFPEVDDDAILPPRVALPPQQGILPTKEPVQVNPLKQEPKPTLPKKKDPESTPTTLSEYDHEIFINESVDFDQIEKDMDAIEERTMTQLISTLIKTRDSLIVFVERNKSTLLSKVADLRLKNMGTIQSIFGEFLRTGYTSGAETMKSELPKDFVDSPQFAPTEALRWLSQKKLIVSGILRDQLLKDVRTSMVSGIENGESIGEIQTRIKKDFEPFIGDTSVLKDQKQLQPFRLETIVRTNLTAAVNQGRIVEARKVSKFLQGMRYSAILDSRTTEVCTLLDGTIFKMGDSAIDSLRPPRHFNCRSQLVAVPIGGSEVSESEFLTAAKAGKAKELSGKGFGVAAKGPSLPRLTAKGKDLPLFTDGVLNGREREAINLWVKNSTIVRNSMVGGAEVSTSASADEAASLLTNMFETRYNPDGDITKPIFRGLSFNPSSEKQVENFNKFALQNVGDEFIINKTFTGFSYDEKVAKKFALVTSPERSSILLKLKKRTTAGFNIFDKSSLFKKEKEVILPNLRVKVVSRKETTVNLSKVIKITIEEVTP